MKGIDLDTFTFDFDLTFAALLMHTDGTVYHRYGGRDSSSPNAFLSMKSFVQLLKDGLDTHRAYMKAPTPPKVKRRTLDDIPVWAKKMAARRKPQSCYHCHFVFDAEREQRMADKTWQRKLIWRFPPPERIGLKLDRDDQRKILAVRPRTPAARAGLRAGDRLVRLGKQRLLTQSDLSWVLEKTPHAGDSLPLAFTRGGKEQQALLPLKSGWRIGTAEEFAWRPSKWQLKPRPGFGGRPLNAKQKARHGVPQDRLAFRVGYVVTWGKIPRYGHAARRAGIRKGDLILDVQVGGKRPKLRDMHHFHAWWRLTRKPGDEVVFTTMRRGKKRTVTITVIE